MANLAVKTQRDINEICLAEGIPAGWTATATIATPISGDNLLNMDFTTGGGLSSYPTGPVFMSYITSLSIISSRDITITIRVDNVANRKFRGPNDQITPNSYARINTRIILKANERFIINGNNIQLLGFLMNFTIVCSDSIGTPVTISCNMLGYNLTKNTNILANRQLLWVGDSISNGSGSIDFESVTSTTPTQSSTPNQEPFSQQVKKYLIYKGYDFWLTNKAQSSMTTDSVVQAIKWGYYDMSNPNFVVIMIGANDAYNLGSGGLSVTANRTIFLQNITFINNYFSKRFPSAKILWLGSTPSATTADETLIEVGRGIISTYINGLNNANIKYYSLATAFDRTNSANYLVSDSIHPTAQNLIATSIQSYIDTTGWFN